MMKLWRMNMIADTDPFGLRHKAYIELLTHLHVQLVRIEKKLDILLEEE